MTKVRQDEIEEKFGITAYASKDVAGFAAILKGRFSDFCVREVDVNGNVARLCSLENNLNPPTPSTKDMAIDINNGDDTSESNSSTIEVKKRSLEEHQGDKEQIEDASNKKT
mmetsp:Transcript_3971/g.5770  ORF Transcript_3971/g.5770 Transcript_3971/m.5770 type:complete len:112 (-) Transcript_3971:11-346(-)